MRVDSVFEKMNRGLLFLIAFSGASIGCESHLGRAYQPSIGLNRFGQYILPKNSNVELVTYCFKTKHDLRVFRTDDSECPKIREVEYFTGLFSVKEADWSDEFAHNLMVIFSSKRIDCPGNRAHGEAVENEEGFTGCISKLGSSDVDYVAMIQLRGRAYVHGGWTSTLYHEFCHKLAADAGIALEDPIHVKHSLPCFRIPRPRVIHDPVEDRRGDEISMRNRVMNDSSPRSPDLRGEAFMTHLLDRDFSTGAFMTHLLVSPRRCRVIHDPQTSLDEIEDRRMWVIHDSLSHRFSRGDEVIYDSLLSPRNPVGACIPQFDRGDHRDSSKSPESLEGDSRPSSPRDESFMTHPHHEISTFSRSGHSRPDLVSPCFQDSRFSREGWGLETSPESMRIDETFDRVIHDSPPHRESSIGSFMTPLIVSTFERGWGIQTSPQSSRIDEVLDRVMNAPSPRETISSIGSFMTHLEDDSLEEEMTLARPEARMTLRGVR